MKKFQNGKKNNEITEFFDELQKNLNLINSQKSQAKKNVKNFYNKNKNFFIQIKITKTLITQYNQEVIIH